MSGIAVTFKLQVDTVGGFVPNAGGNYITVTTDVAGRAMLPSPGLVAGPNAGAFTFLADSPEASSAAVFNMAIDAGHATTLTARWGANQSARINTPYAQPFVVYATGADGGPVPYAAIQFWAAPGGASGTFNGVNTLFVAADASGMATSPTFVANGIVGGGTVSALAFAPLNVSQAPVAFFGYTNTSDTAYEITSVGGYLLPTVRLTFPVVVKLTRGGVPVPNHRIDFELPTAGFAILNSNSAVTDASGIAQVSATASSTTGYYTITARHEGVGFRIELANQPSTAPLVLEPLPGTTPQTVALGSVVPVPLAVRLTMGGAPVPGQWVNFQSPGIAPTAWFTGTNSAGIYTDNEGIARAPAMFAQFVPGVIQVRAWIVPNGGGAEVETFFQLTLGSAVPTAARSVLVSAPPLTMTATTTAAAPFVVRALDASDRPVSGVQVLFSTEPGCGTFGGSVQSYAFTNSSGDATSPLYVSGSRLGPCLVVALVGGARENINLWLTIVAQPPPPPSPVAAQLQVVSGTPQSAGYGTSLAPFVVRVLDSSGNPLPGARVSFSVTPACGSFGAGATDDALADASGRATSPAFVTSSQRGPCAVAATSGAARADLPFTIYAPYEVALRSIPPALSLASGLLDFSFQVEVTSVLTGAGLPGARVTFTNLAGEYIPGTAIGAVYLAATTDASGRATARGITGTGATAWTVIASFAGVTLNIPATQSAPATPPPPPPRAAASFTGPLPGGQGTLTMNIVGGGPDCGFTYAYLAPSIELALPPIPPATGMRFPLGYAGFRMQKCTPGAAITMQFVSSGALPPGATFMSYGPTAERPLGTWYEVPMSIGGNTVSITLADGGLGDDDRLANGDIRGVGGFAVRDDPNPGLPHAIEVVTNQGLWWSGTVENGWGMSIVQHRDVLFSNIYVYGDDGRPMWLVMPGGSWNAARTAFSGALYIPRGAPYYAYDVSRFNIGAPIGTATLTFTDGNTGRFDYTINGVSGSKAIERMAFGRPESQAALDVADLWWGGIAQNGWGITVLQQVRTLFALWFTYDADGAPTWYVMPGGEWTASDSYEGRIYRAVGSKWIGAAYDATQHRTIDVGSFRLRFTGENATLEYTIEGRSGTVPLTRLAF